MSSEELFLQSIGITNLEKYKDYKIMDVTLNERKREFNVKMALPEVVIPEDIDGLWMAGRRGINGNIKVNLELFQEKRNPEEIIKIFKYVLNDFTKMKPSLIGVVDNNVTLALEDEAIPTHNLAFTGTNGMSAKFFYKGEEVMKGG